MSILNKYWPAVLCVAAMTVSCSQGGQQTEEPADAQNVDHTIKITSTGMNFESADTFASGWVTFEYSNHSNEVHFVLLEQYPQGKNLDTAQEIIEIFQVGMDLIEEGDMDAAMAAFGGLPSWFSEVVFLGSTGLTSPHQVSRTTQFVEPGHYFIECYVKMEDGTFHNKHGMMKELWFTEEATSQAEPSAFVSVHLDTTGMRLEGVPVAGKQRIAVHYGPQKVHANFVGHDVHLVKVGEGDLDTLIAWMPWTDPRGLINPAPEGFTFLGGVNEMPEGKHAYFEADLTPGNYVFISEVPNAKTEGYLLEFSVE